tara:strand:- start:13336 stop:13632 length:297 start_codon:yes stop_codon:yes gene_type:complete
MDSHWNIDRNLDNSLFDKFSTREKMEITTYLERNNLIGQTVANGIVFLIGSLLEMERKLGESFGFHAERNSELIDEVVDLRRLVQTYQEKIKELENGE